MKTHAAIVLALLALTAAPASAAANKEHLQLLAEIRMLQEQNQQLQALLGTLQDTLKTVTTKLDDQSASTRKAMADQTLAVTNMGDNVRVLREKTDETNVRMSSVSQEIEALRQAIVSSQSGQPLTPTPVNPTDPNAPVATGQPPAGGLPPGISPQRAYDTSYDDYTAGRYDLAIQGFQAFIQAFPRMANAADAQYNIGMSYYNLSKWNEARDAFQKVIADYPQQTNRVSDAYYKLGQTYEQLKQPDEAKKAYETVVQKYPGSGAYAFANQALQRLNRREDDDPPADG
jgi:tol-pal system protein YbgF